MIVQCEAAIGSAIYTNGRLQGVKCPVSICVFINCEWQLELDAVTCWY
jgi:hypothetical protein